jgi:inner membrane protein
MEKVENSMFSRFGHWVKTSLLVKLSSIGVLILILLIPKSMIDDLIWERQGRQQEAIQEVGASWGAPQTIIGPLLSIPYSEWTQLENGKKVESVLTAWFLPLELNVTGKVNPELRKRGIYEIVLYQSELLVAGKFAKPDFAALNISPENVHWDQAKLSIGIKGMSGIKNSIQLDWSGTSIRMEPGTANSKILLSGVSNTVPTDPESAEYSFSIPLKLNGSGYLKFEPVGKENKVSLESSWPSPSFEGEFLPDQREITPEGFRAAWTVLDMNRNYPQQWKGYEYAFSSDANPDSKFGVRLLQTVDEYAKTERSSKYAILVIGLTFLIYFFFETLRKFHIHPFQYFLVGLALSIFYLLLLSLSEHLGFNVAYFIAAAATIGLITVYSSGVFKSRRLTIQLFLLLLVIYGFVFTVLQLEDYALLAGSIGIFGALAVVMLYLRNVDWYNLSENDLEEPGT